ncbi:MAG: hypothetical protein M1825_002633 [Sarcosagium campestre]|nr:MAG: hypothetical protein M1825_002633 [Sarcosagium campestre]
MDNGSHSKELDLAIWWPLRGDALRHCVRISGARLFIVDEELSPHVSDVSNELKTMLSMVVIFLDRDLKTRINASDPRRPDDDVRSGAKDSDPMALFYTSGTTGMPKAVPFPLSRAFYSGAVRFRLFDIRKGERWYNCMPLYHGTGGVTICACLMTGFPVAIGKRFSASGFWDDVRDSKANCFIYVGETMRYLVASPPTPKDKDHSVRCIYGNGLRPDMWAKVRERFAIADIIEIFNSSEGMLALTNQNKGDFSAYSVGHHGLILRLLNYNSIVPVLASPSTTELIRDPTTGFATRQPYLTGGEILIRIDSPAAFPGYHNNPVATSAKLERDVFRKGDLYYRTGDALRRDDNGRWYFLDRLGDTFRWKSENVSTTEVAAVLGSFPAVIEANVYGVLVPGHEGRAGCAALFIEHDKRDLFDYAALLAHASANLPLYAVPVFIRVVTHMSHIHNLKQDKVQLRRQGINPTEVSLEGDRLLWRPPGGHKTGYVEFGEEDWKAVVAGKARL